MGKRRGTYNGGSSVVTTNPWVTDSKPPRQGRLGVASIAAADADKFVRKTYVVTVEEKDALAAAKAQEREKLRDKKKEPAHERSRKFAKLKEKKKLPEYEIKAAAIKERQEARMRYVIVEIKRKPRTIIRKAD